MHGRKLMELYPPDEPVDAVCNDCITDHGLKKIFKPGSKGICAACGEEKRIAINSEMLSNNSARVIRDHFKEPLSSDEKKRAVSLTKVLQEVTGILSDDFCNILADIIVSKFNKDKFFSKRKKYFDAFLGNKTDFNKWDLISFNLMYKQRFFNDEAGKFFEILLNEAGKTKASSLFPEVPAAKTSIKAGQTLYRARKMGGSVKDEIEKDAEAALGAPPKILAGHNRMNPAGISLFYSALDRETAIAEIRPSIGDRVVVGKFKTTRDLIFFNFTGFTPFSVMDKISHWHEPYSELIHVRSFLRILHDTISQPILGDGSGYIITQAFTEYIRHRHGEKFDGLIFRSVQNKGGVNYVIFGDRSDEEIFDSAWEEKFPVKLDGKFMINNVTGIQYTGNWE